MKFVHDCSSVHCVTKLFCYSVDFKTSVRIHHQHPCSEFRSNQEHLLGDIRINHKYIPAEMTYFATLEVMFVIDSSAPEKVGPATIHLIELLNHSALQASSPYYQITHLIISFGPLNP